MHYAAAAIMLAIYMYNLPLTIAVIWREAGFSVGVGLLDGRFAISSAEKRLTDKSKARGSSKKPDVETAVKTAKELRLDYFSVRLLVGAGDAAKTAVLCGLMRTLGNVLLAVSGNGTVDIRPDFTGETLKGECSATFSVKLGRLALAAAAGAVSGVNIGRQGQDKMERS